MPVESNSQSWRFASAWIYRRTIPGYSPARQRGTLTATINPDADEFNHKFFDQYEMEPGDTQIIDLRQFVSEVSGESVTASKVLTLEIKATGDPGGKLKIQPHSVNGLVWPFGDASDSLTLNVGSLGQCALAIQDGDPAAVGDGERNILLTNTGTEGIVVWLAATVGE